MEIFQGKSPPSKKERKRQEKEERRRAKEEARRSKGRTTPSPPPKEGDPDSFTPFRPCLAHFFPGVQTVANTVSPA